MGYSRWCPSIGDGTYVRCLVRAVVDRSHKVKYRHQTQRVQVPNSKAQKLSPQEADRIGWGRDSAGSVPG
eukprot:4446419-Karenia_brevis.AAC.1